jgi:carbon monoxide dehydrogenase subunit G
MSTIEGKRVRLARSAAEISELLQDMTRLKEFLPQDRISDWSADTAQCSFNVQGVARIGLRLEQGLNPMQVRLVATDGSPFPFTMVVNLHEVDGATEVWQTLEADLNPFIRMMVERPLKNLFDHIADKLHGKYA